MGDGLSLAAFPNMAFASGLATNLFHKIIYKPIQHFRMYKVLIGVHCTTPQTQSSKQSIIYTMLGPLCVYSDKLSPHSETDSADEWPGVGVWEADEIV